MPLLTLVLACNIGTAANPTSHPPTPASTPTLAPAPAPAPVGGVAQRPLAATGVLLDSCEPSSMLSHSGGWLVGDNEDSSQLYVFAPTASTFGPPVPLSTPVDDIEALAKYGDEIIVIGSHSRNKKGEARPERARILITQPDRTPTLDRLFPLDVSICGECVASQSLPPNEGGFNIEGAVVVGDQLALGLRSPLDRGRARLLLAPLHGPNSGRTTEVKTYDLGGDGFREIIPWKAGYLIVAGAVADGGAHPLFWLPGLESVPTKIGELPAGTESILPLDPNELWYLIDGDGKPGKCKTPGAWGMLSVTLP